MIGLAKDYTTTVMAARSTPTWALHLAVAMACAYRASVSQPRTDEERARWRAAGIVHGAALAELASRTLTQAARLRRGR